MCVYGIILGARSIYVQGQDVLSGWKKSSLRGKEELRDRGRICSDPAELLTAGFRKERRI